MKWRSSGAKEPIRLVNGGRYIWIVKKKRKKKGRRNFWVKIDAIKGKLLLSLIEKK